MSEKKGNFEEEGDERAPYRSVFGPSTGIRDGLPNGLMVSSGETLIGSVSEFLEEMKTRHIANIEACERT